MAATDSPSLLGLKPSFGFGDRLGVATPGHILACRKGHMLPVFAQQSARELARTQRTPDEVMRCAQNALRQHNWTGAWGADADHLRTQEDVEYFAAAGFTFFTIDPSAYVNNAAGHLNHMALQLALDELCRAGAFASVLEIESLYMNRSFDLPGSGLLAFTDRELLLRTAVKYGLAIAYAQQMAAWIAGAAATHEIELSVDETDTPTSPLEHLFIALELRRRNIRVVSLAPRFLGDFEKGVDYKGRLEPFEAALRLHVAIARQFGPYKISVHSGSDKFRIYPIIGRVCGDLLHVKTAGTSYLEALRVLARVRPALFLELIEFSRARYDKDRASYHVSANLSDARPPGGLNPQDREQEYLDMPAGRQILHVTFGAALTAGRTHGAQPFKEAILETLAAHADLHNEVLARHLGRHLELLSAG